MILYAIVVAGFVVMGAGAVMLFIDADRSTNTRFGLWGLITVLGGFITVISGFIYPLFAGFEALCR